MTPADPQGRAVLPEAGRAQTRRALGRRLRPRARLLTVAAVLFVTRALVGLVGPAALGRIVDVVVDGRAAGAVTPPVVLLAAAALIEGLLAWLAPAAAANAAEPALAELREEVVDRVLHISPDVIERAGTGDVVARVDGDVASVNQAINEAFPEVLQAGLTIGLTVVGLALLDWRLALAGLCAAPIQLHTVRWYLPRSNPLYRQERRAAAERSQQLIETIGGAETVQALGLAGRQLDRVATTARRAVDLTVAATWLRTRFFARLNLAEAVGLGAILVTGFVLVDNGTVTVGAVTAAALYFQRLFDPINILLYLLDEAQAATAALARLVGVADLPADDPAADVADGGRVELSGVHFAYDQGHEVLHGVDLVVDEHTTVALVGTSGAGKTTIAKLLAGIYRPGYGSATVGGAPVATAIAPDGRSPVVLVTQDVHVFAGALRDDLRLAKPEATDEELHGALDRVGASRWIGSLPDGLDTVVGDGGIPLDGTRAQQLALARLVLADPLVAVLDEATAEAGSAGARALEAAARRAVEGRTALVIAHRLSQAATADQIVVLDDGRVVEIGSHQTLIAGDGRYAALWQAWSSDRPPVVDGAGPAQ